jgi:hypothetical protein
MHSNSTAARLSGSGSSRNNFFFMGLIFNLIVYIWTARNRIQPSRFQPKAMLKGRNVEFRNKLAASL